MEILNATTPILGIQARLRRGEGPKSHFGASFGPASKIATDELDPGIFRKRRAQRSSARDAVMEGLEARAAFP
jgi:hypothetical protein